MARKKQTPIDNETIDITYAALESGLTGLQLRFAQEYLVDLNGTRAAQRAGYSGDDTALAVIASRNLRNTKVLAYVSACLSAYTMSASEVLTQLTDIARGDIADVMDSAGGIDPTEARRRGKSHLIKRFKTKVTTIDGGGKDGAGDTEIVETEVELHDRLRAIELLSKYHDLTNKLRIDDWQAQAIEDIKAGRILYTALAEAFDSELATRLFAAAGVPIQT